MRKDGALLMLSVQEDDAVIPDERREKGKWEEVRVLD